MRHPNVVGLYGIYVSPDRDRYMVTELSMHGDLLGFLKKNQSTLSMQHLLSMYDTSFPPVIHFAD